MTGALLLLATCITAAIGFALMAASQKQHWPLLPLSRRPAAPAWLRPAGWLLVFLAIIPAIVRDGLAFGLLVWSGMITMSAALVVVGLALRARDQV